MFQKIVIRAPKVKIAVGTILGLDTKWASNHAAFIERVKAGYYKVTTAISFPRGAVFYVDCDTDPKKREEQLDRLMPKYKDDRGDTVSAYEVVDMPVGYLEESAADKAKRDAILKPKGKAKAA